MNEIELDIIVDVSENHLTVEEFTDKFIEWIEENNWTCGGVFKWGGEEEPYCTIEVATKEDYEKLQKALEKQTPRKPLEQRYVNYEIENELIGHCPACKLRWDVAYWQRHCSNCGQKLDWSWKNE